MLLPAFPEGVFPISGGNVCSPEHSKLCFLQHASASAAKNACPCRGRNLAPKSQIVGEGIMAARPQTDWFHKLETNKYE